MAADLAAASATGLDDATMSADSAASEVESDFGAKRELSSVEDSGRFESKRGGGAIAIDGVGEVDTHPERRQRRADQDAPRPMRR